MTGDHDTITLKDAAQHFGFGVWTLRAEAQRGRLTVYKIGRQYYTTPADIREMVELCRVEQKAPAFTVTRRAVSSSLETDRASYDSAQRATLKLRSGWPSISPENIGRSKARRRS